MVAINDQNPVMNPAQLLERARQGDGQALGLLLETYRSYLLFLARGQIGTRLQGKIDASDVVQEAFLGAARDFAQFRGDNEKAFAAWLRQSLASVVANLVRHYQGTQSRDIRLERRLAGEFEESSRVFTPELAAPQSSPSQQASRREQAVLMTEALSRIPPFERELLRLRHLEGLTFPEVAQRMNSTIDRVKKHWPRALAQLRRLLETES